MRLFPYIAVIVLATIMLHFDVLFFGEVYSPSGDITYQNYPWRDFYASELKSGRLAMWYPYQACGFPLFAEGQTGMLYPPNLVLHYFLGTWRAIVFGCVLHTLIAGLGAFFMFTRLGLTKRAALFAGVVYMASGPMIAHLGHFNVIAAASWLPWIVMYGLACAEVNSNAVTDGKRERHRRFFRGSTLAFIIALSWLAGHPQTTIISIVTFVVVALVRFILLRKELALRARDIAVRFAAPFVGIFAGTVAAMPQLWFTLELVRQSNRASFTLADFFSYSLPPTMLATLVHPFVFGAANAWNSPEYRGPDGFVERVAFIGIIPTLLVLFALIGLFLKRNLFSNTTANTDVKSTRFLVVSLSISLLILLLFAFGKWGGIYLLLKLIPGYGATRIPARFVFPVVLILGGLSGITLDVFVLAKMRVARFSTYIYALFLLLTFINLQWFHKSFNLTSQEDAATPIPEAYKAAKKGGRYSRVYYIPQEFFAIDETTGVFARTDIDFNKPCYPAVAGMGSVTWAGELVLRNYKRFLDNTTELMDNPMALERRAETIAWLAALPSGAIEMAQYAKSGAYMCAAVKVFDSEDALFDYIKSTSPLYLDQIALLTAEPELKPSMRGAAHIATAEETSLKHTYNIVSSEDRIFVRTVPYYNGWRAYMDGRKTKIIKADGAFQAVEIPKGEHTLEFEFGGRLPYLLIPVQIAILTVLFLNVIFASYVTQRDVQKP